MCVHNRMFDFIFSALVVAFVCVGCGDDNGGGGTSNPDAGVDTGGENTPDLTGLIINEVAAAGDPDWFELYNSTDRAISLEEATFTDDLSNPTRGLFAEGESVAAGGYVVIYLSDEWPGFKLGSDEELGIYDHERELVDSVDWDEGESPSGGSYARIPDGTGPFKRVQTATPGAANIDNAGGAECGNGEREEGEECDDGNLVSGDLCSSDCRVEVPPECGNGLREDGEECDSESLPTEICDVDCRQIPNRGQLRLNEVAADLGEEPDAIEIHNLGAEPLSLGGWIVTDRDPSHTLVLSGELGGGGYLVLTRGVDFEWGLGAEDSVLLYHPDGTLRDRVDWVDGDLPEGQSLARQPDGTGPFVVGAPTFGLPNTNED